MYKHYIDLLIALLELIAKHIDLRREKEKDKQKEGEKGSQMERENTQATNGEAASAINFKVDNMDIIDRV